MILKKQATFLVTVAVMAPLVTSQNWIYQPSATSNSSTGWAVGVANTVIRTDDGALSWYQQQTGLPNNLTWTTVSFASARVGWIASLEGHIAKSGDGGSTWALQQGGSSSEPLMQLLALSEATALAVGYNGTVLRTDDGGVNWRDLAKPTTHNLHGLAFPSADDGWVVGEHGTIFRTLDGGQNWTLQLSDIRFTGALLAVDMATLPGGFFYGWAAGTGGVVLHTLDGSTWFSQGGCGNASHTHYDLVTYGPATYIVGQVGICYIMDG
eukprot:gene10336-12222_t